MKDQKIPFCRSSSKI